MAPRKSRPRSRRNKNASKVITHRRYGVQVARHRHSGRRISFRYTSYTLLFFLLILTGAILVFAGHLATADIIEQGDISLSGKILGPPPVSAAVITNPANGQHFSNSVIEVDGTCTNGLIVEMYRTAIFAGSVVCSDQGAFHLSLTLIPGQNDLRARIRDGAGQYGPDSATITVFYDIAKQSPGGAPVPTALPFLIYTEPVQRGLGNDQAMVLKYEINGGKPPYAIAINWGDGSKVDANYQAKEGDFTANHHFVSAGQFTISISGNDAAHNHAFIQSIGVIQGRPVSAVVQTCNDFSAPTGGYCTVSNQLTRLVNGLWPAFIVACLMTLSFWLGERLVYQRLKPRLRRA